MCFQHCGRLRVSASPLLKHEVEGVRSAGQSTLQRRQDQTVAITGINTFGVQPRLEIRQLQQNADQWNIFLLGMRRFQQTNQSDLTSYYQVRASTHIRLLMIQHVDIYPGELTY
jgi:tyrosinase